MNLIPEWKTVLLRAHSSWAFFLSLALLLAPDLIYWLWLVDTNPRLWWVAGVAALVYGLIGRIVNQGISRDRTHSPWAVALLAVLAVGWGAAQDVRLPPPQLQVEASHDPAAATMQIAVPLVAKWEGLELLAYRDPVGIWTVCYGETRNVQPGDRYTEAECRIMLARRLLEFHAGLHRYFTAETRTARLPPPRDAAYVSFAYNVGVSGAGRSTAVRRLNAGDIRGGCEALGWWNKAGGRVLRGLINRRAEETRLCLQGLAA